ncbi:MAG TPA: alpha-2-macroglobulin family protein [Myxococcaceae bacterium]|nr:alpha-2-macroglobulin family protein [Myxococcaceae bacterium]
MPPAIQVSPEPVPGSEGQLAVVAARPRGVAGSDVRPSLTFSRPVMPLGTVEAQGSVPPPARLEPPVAGEWRWLGSASVEFVPRDPLPFSTRFTVTVPAGLRSVDGQALREPYAWSFETPAPAVQRVDPVPGWDWVTPGQHFVLVLNQRVVDLERSLALLVGAEAAPWPLTVVKAEPVDDGGETSGRPRPAVRSRQVRYELALSRPLPLDARVTLVLAGSLRGAEGALTLGEDRRWSFHTYGPLSVAGPLGCAPEARQCPYGPLLLFTSNPVKVSSLREHLSVEPRVSLDWERAEVLPGSAESRPAVAIPGRFRPGTTYRITVSEGVLDEFGQRGASGGGSFRTTDLEPGFDPGPDVALLEAQGDGALPVEVTNLSRLEAQVWALTPAELARFLGARRREALAPPGSPLAYTLATSGSPNVLVTRGLPVRRLLAGRGTNLFHAVLTAPERPDEWGRVRTVTGQITDLVVHAKLGATSSAAWVTRLSDGRPVPGADLVLYDRSGTGRWRGKTDADGLARLPGLAELLPTADGSAWEPPFALLAATLGNDTGVTLSTWMGGFGPWAFDLRTEWDGRTPKALGTVFAERGIYRPGDTVFLKGLLRTRELGALRTPRPGTPVQLRVTSSRGKEVAARNLALSDFGTFATELSLDREVPLGTFQVTARAVVHDKPVVIGGSFRVEEYRPPQFRVDVKSPSRDLAASDAVGAQVSARYLFGGAMAGSEVRWTVTRTSTAFSPPGNEGFAFGAEVAAWDEESPQPVSDVFAAGEGKTDAQGLFSVQAGKAEAPGGRTYLDTVEAEVTDVNRQRQAGRVGLTVHPAAVYAGVRPRSTGFAEARKPVTLEVVAVRPDGTRQPGVAVDVAVVRREWRFIRKKDVGDRWTTLSEPVEEVVDGCQVRSESVPVACTFTPAQGGFHVVKAVAHDAAGRSQTTTTGLYVLGPGWVSWQRNDTDRIDLVPDRQLYGVGETARVLVKSPFPEAEALLTVEREGVLSVRRIRLTGAATALDVPLGEAEVPNVFVSVLLVRGRVEQPPGSDLRDDPGRPTVRVGYAQLRVERKSKRLSVELTPDGVERRPRDRVAVRIQVRDWKGKGTPSEVTVWAVDEGVLRLTDYQVPDPVEAVHPLRGLSVRLGEPLVHLVQRKLYGEKGGIVGGGGGAEGTGTGFRSEFRTTALFSPSVVTDDDGRAQVEFSLPDNLTTYRLMALALTRGERMGTGQSQVVVAKPLLALPALPRFLRTGDVAEAGVVVHAPGGRIHEAEVRAEVQGLVLEGPSVTRVSLPDARPREVRFRFRAEAPGEAVLRFRVTGGGEQDGVEQRIPVQLPTSLEAVAVSGDTTGARQEALQPPAGIRPDVGGLELTLASTALGGFSEAMRQLVDYPYGCLEQLSSRLVPFVALRELSGRFGVPWTPDAAIPWVGGGEDPDALIRRTVKAIEQLQGPDGGYRIWSSDGCSSEWASPYAVLALGRAAELGAPVDAAALRRGQEFLARVVASGVGVRCRWWWMERLDDTTRTFAVWALARTGAPRASYDGELFSRREQLPLFARAMLADAMFIGGADRAQARTALTELLDRAKESPQGLHFEEMNPRTYASRWSSDVRTSALVLLTLTDVSPDHPFVAKLAHYLASARGPGGRYRTTQEAAFALMALTEVARVKERTAPDFVARVSLAGKELSSAPFRGRSLEVRRVHVGLDRLPRGTAAVPLDFRREGPAGVLYYGALLRYAPAALPLQALDRGIVVQRWVEPYSGGGQVKAVPAGELVRIQVRVASPQERSNVAVEVPLPAGLEAVDTSLATSARLPPFLQGQRAPRGEDDDEGDGEPGEASLAALGFWSPFNHTERRDDRVVLFADRLPPGIHLTTVIARATTPGDFLLSPAHAEEMYAPEVFGRSDGGHLRVVEGASLASK